FIGLALLLFKAEWEKKILAASMLMIAFRLVANICDSFLCCLALFFMHTVKKIQDPVLSDWRFGIIGVVSICSAALAVYRMSKHLTSVFHGKPGKWYVMLAIPLLMIIVVFDVADWGACHGIMVRSGGNMKLYYDQIFSHTEFFVLAVLSMLAAGFYVFGMERIYLEQEKNRQYNSQIMVYKMLTEQYRQSERLRHDMKNHVIALSGLFQNKEWDKMGDYLKNMESGCLESGEDMTGNKAVDALLYQKQKQAERENIRWECDVRIPKACCINEFDLCVLFGNILDNALEACERLISGKTLCEENCEESGFINIQAKAVKSCLLIEVKNSMDITEKYAVGTSNKESAQEHGIGLLNINDVVQRYNGVVSTEAENGIFVISVLMPLTDAEHDIKEAV
ncbi:MAG: ATP-binding protein, partial [Lachnospiraceae bacterium]|nr:ATP-binding protein [Lachnospiraceae bacterium]